MKASHLYVRATAAMSTAALLLAPPASAQIIQEEIHEEDTILSAPAGYTIERIAIPEDIELEVGGLDVRDDGSLLIANRNGEIWEYDPANENWRRLAEGLFSPLGIRLDHETGDLFVAQMPELTRLVDTDNDGRFETKLTLADDWDLSGNYHEYAFGPVIDNEGNFYVSLNLTAQGANRVKGSTMGRNGAYRGWVVKITPEGDFVPFASGLRSPAGIGINRADEIFVTDNQGDWVPTSYLAHIQEGRFYGHPNSLLDHPDFRGYTLQDLNEIPNADYDKLRTRPAVHFPHLAMAQSPGEPLVNETGGAFGPFEGQIFVGDQTFSKVMRVALEKVQGEYQGTVFDFARGLDSGVLREVFSPDGRTMWVGQTDRGWKSVGGIPFSLQKITYDGETIPFEMQTIHVKRDGFEIVFTKPVDRARASDPANYDITHWTYHFRPEYGSPRVDERPLPLARATVSADGRRVRLSADAALEAERIFAIALSDIEGANGENLLNRTGYYTLNNLPE